MRASLIRALIGLSAGAGLVLLTACFTSDSQQVPDAALDVGTGQGSFDAAPEAAVADSGVVDAPPEVATEAAVEDAAAESSAPDGEPMEASAGDDATGPCDSSCPVGTPCITPTDCVTLYCNSSHLCESKPSGISCSNDVECTSNVCLNEPGGSANKVCCSSACPMQSKDTCGNTGYCWYTGRICETWNNLTPCHTCSGSTLTTSHCSGGNNNMINPGACAPGGTSAPCPNNLACADAYSCLTVCSVTGTAPAGTSVGCAAGTYCDTVPSTPVCSNTRKAPTTPCNNSFECASGTCASGKCG
jgi:hypothetical protein